MKKIAIVGSNSFVAKNLIRKVSKDNYIYLYGKNLVETKDESLSFVSYFNFDYPNWPLDLTSLLNYDVIVYTAAVGVQSNNRPANLLLYQVNLFLPIEIVTFLNDNNYKGKFITFGSYFEIGTNDKEKLYNEIEVIQSVGAISDSYCDSKRLLSNFYLNKQFNILWYHLILPSIYGPNENDNRLIPYVINTIKEDLDPKLSSGDQVRQYLYISDLVELIDKIINTDIPADVYNVASCTDSIKIKDLVSLIYEIMGKQQKKYDQIVTRDQGMAFLGLNTDKISYAIPEWKPKVFLKDGIKKYL
ncbi:NAD-dependent epimerase/dehydratase family protein [Flavobacterium johnsoniae]|uniref:Nucleoside-diphosphate-sugar epimerase n=1 Tax=Flavobacterium johnsoniae TaxID=986 RepID=A0A1M5L5D1_FLAJO|nr:NAD(P)-dependent oxidoreductase [Flavobacterium johnsoniae]SHG59989.1 Nucleoside-diphosphate-sugar epimerase [Flavobacterium johnsoniae]